MPNHVTCNQCKIYPKIATKIGMRKKFWPKQIRNHVTYTPSQRSSKTFQKIVLEQSFDLPNHMLITLVLNSHQKLYKTWYER
jgi:hypothetical protein